METVLIIGAGPSAYITALTCLQLNFQTTIVNPEISNWDDIKVSNLDNKLILKHRRKKENPYSLPAKINTISSNTVDIFENFAFGGLSNIWGGVFFPPAISEIGFNSETTNSFTEALSFVENSLDIDTINEVYMNMRSPLISTKRIKGKPVIARSKSDSTHNWSAAELFKSKEFLKTEFIDGYVKSINQNTKKSVEITIINKKNENINLNFNKVFLAAGVFGTARILLESAPGLNSLEIMDSGVSFGLGIDLTTKSTAKIDKLMTPEKVMLEFGRNKKVRHFVQVYRISVEMLESLKYQYLYKVLFQVIKLLGVRLRLIMCFQPAIYSKTILLKKESSNLIATSGRPKKHNKLSAFKKLKIYFRANLIPLSFFITAKPGAGVHSGAYIPTNKAKHNGVIPTAWADWPDVHVVGSASLPSVPTGPIMLAGMANSRVISLNVLTENK